MKTSNRSASFRTLVQIISPLLPLALGTVLLVGAPTGCRAADSDRTPSGTPAPQAVVPTKQSSSTNVSAAVSEILKLADAGVTSGVIKAYAESVPPVVQITAGDVIALKEHKVADEVALLMLKRGAEVREAAARVRKDNATRQLDSRLRAAGGFDPEGYDYFQYYYLQPRALASAYQRLSPYGYHPYSYRYLVRP